MSGDVTIGALNRILIAKGVMVKPNTNASNTPLALLPADIDGAFDVSLNLTAALAGAGSATLPTVSALLAHLANAAPGQSYNLRVINSSSGAFAWTILTNTGWTLTGTMSVAQNTFRDFYIVFGANKTATLTSVGTGTYS